MGISELAAHKAARGERKSCGSLRKSKEVPVALPGFLAAPRRVCVVRGELAAGGVR